MTDRRSLLVAALAGLLAGCASVLAAASLVLSPAFVAASETVDRHGIEGEPILLAEPTEPGVSAYLEGVTRKILKNWAFPCIKNPESGACEYKTTSVAVEFGILRDGPVAYVEIRTPAGFPIYDEFAINAIKGASPFPPVPDVVMDRMKPGSTSAAIRANFHYKVEADPRDILR